LVLPEKLYHADYIEPAEGLSNGSVSVLNEAGFERHRHADTLLNICGQVGLPRRLSLGECLTCESHRSQKRFDLFLQGQDLFHLFLMGDVYSIKRKRYNSNEWESMSMFNQTRLGLQSDPPVEDAGATEKQAEEAPPPADDPEPEEARLTQTESTAEMEDNEEEAADDPEPEEARAASTAEMEDNEEEAADDPEPEEARLTQAESTAEMEDNEEEAADDPEPEEARPAVVTQVDNPEPEKARLTQAESIAEMEDKEEVAAETTVALDEVAAEPMVVPAVDTEATAEDAVSQAKSTAEMERKDAKGKYVNDNHWMELNFAVSLFCYDYCLRVVVYYSVGDTWSTYIFDGRDVGTNDSVDGLRVQFLDGMVPVTGRERSFGLHYDGEHYEHLTLPV
jgi:hypothetical protein